MCSNTGIALTRCPMQDIGWQLQCGPGGLALLPLALIVAARRALGCARHRA